MPGDALTVVSTADGARKRFGWAELASYEPDGVKIDVVSTITVKTKPNGKTLILFGVHEARGQLGTCVAQIAARTTIAKGQRLSFKL